MGEEKAHDPKYTTVSGGGGRVMSQVCMDAIEPGHQCL